jgi:hypothetical protein
MRRYGELSKNQEPSWSHQSCPDCIIATRGYDFREGQVGLSFGPRNLKSVFAQGALHQCIVRFQTDSPGTLCYSRTITDSGPAQRGEDLPGAGG